MMFNFKFLLFFIIMLKDICEYFFIDIGDIIIKRKVLYILRFENFLK